MCVSVFVCICVRWVHAPGKVKETPLLLLLSLLLLLVLLLLVLMLLLFKLLMLFELLLGWIVVLAVV
jgi:hypothetical protein